VKRGLILSLGLSCIVFFHSTSQADFFDHNDLGGSVFVYPNRSASGQPDDKEAQ
jgi:hypothetical protein